MDAALLKKFVGLGEEIKEEEAAVKTKKEELDQLGRQVLKAFQKLGVTNMTLADGRTVYLRKKVHVNRVKGKMGDEEFAVALRALELGDFVSETVSGARLAGYVRELLQKGEQVPESIAAGINIYEEYNAVARGTGKGKVTDGQEEE